MPPLWNWRFGPSVGKRFAGAFFGGALMMFGARHGARLHERTRDFSGALQLALSSWIFVFLIFAGGAATAFALYGKEGRSHV